LGVDGGLRFGCGSTSIRASPNFADRARERKVQPARMLLCIVNNIAQVLSYLCNCGRSIPNIPMYLE